METCLQPLWNLLREPCNQLMEISDFEDNSNRQILMLNNPVPVSLLSGDRKPQIRFLGNHPSGSGNLYHKSFRM